MRNWWRWMSTMMKTDYRLIISFLSRLTAVHKFTQRRQFRRGPRPAADIGGDISGKVVHPVQRHIQAKTGGNRSRKGITGPNSIGNVYLSALKY